MNDYLVSVDVAKKYDRTTIAIGKVTHSFGNDGRSISYLDIIDLQMIEKLSYPDQARYLKKLDLNSNLHMNNDLIVDSTGVGEAMCDNLEDIGLNPHRIIFTGGDNSSIKSIKSPSGFLSRITYNVPKVELIDTLKLMLQQQRLRIAKGISFEKDIREQLMHFVGKMSKSKNMIYGNDKDDIHDDIVCALAMSSWFFAQENGARSDFQYDPSYTQGDSMRYKRMKRTTDYSFEDYL